MYLSGLHSLPKQKYYELLANLWYRYVSANITSLKIIVTLTVHQAFWYRRKQEIKNKKIQIQEKQEKTRKFKFFVKNFSNKCKQIRSFLTICLHLVKN